MESRRVVIAVTVIVIAILAIGIGYAYTATSVNSGNQATPGYIELTQTNNYSFGQMTYNCDTYIEYDGAEKKYYRLSPSDDVVSVAVGDDTYTAVKVGSNVTLTANPVNLSLTANTLSVSVSSVGMVAGDGWTYMIVKETVVNNVVTARTALSTFSSDTDGAWTGNITLTKGESTYTEVISLYFGYEAFDTTATAPANYMDTAPEKLDQTDKIIFTINQ